MSGGVQQECDRTPGNESLEYIYTDAFYYVIVTMSSVGYGDYSPQSNSEKWVGIIIIVVGSFLFAYIIGTFSNMINTLTADNDEFDAKMREVGELMRFHSVPRRLHEQVLEFYEFKFSSKVIFDERQMYGELPASLRHALVLHRFAPTVAMVPFLHGIRPDVIVELCMHMSDYPVMPNEHIMVRGAFQRELLVLTRGKAVTVPDHDHQLETATQGDLEEQAENAEDAAIDNTRVPKHSIDHHKKYRHKKRAPLHKGRGHEVGSFWGELEFLGVTQTRIATVDATTYCELAALHPDKIEDVLDRHPFVRERLRRYAKLRQEVDEMMSAGASLKELEAKLKDSAAEVQSIQVDAEHDVAVNINAPPSPRTASVHEHMGLTLVEDKLAGLTGRVDYLEERVGERMDKVEAAVTAQTAALTAAIDALGERLAG